MFWKKDVNVTCKYDNLLGQLKANSDQHTHLLHDHSKMLERLIDIGAKNSANLEHHIKRTDILQSRQYKLIILVALGIGAASVYLGPSALRFLGLIL